MSTKVNETTEPTVDETPRSSPLEQDVRNFLLRETTGKHYVRATVERLLENRSAMVAVLAGFAVVVAMTSYLIGKAGAEPAEVDPSGGYFITEDQAQELRDQATDLSSTKSRLAIAEGELAFLRTQVRSLTTETQTLQTESDRMEIELGVMIGVYEECLRQPYPAECLDQALADAETFLANLYTSGG